MWLGGYLSQFEAPSLTVVAERSAICSFGGLAVNNKYVRNVGLVRRWHFLAHHERVNMQRIYKDE